MKKFYSFLVAAVLLMGATSCQKEATADAGAADNVEFVASIAGGRTELGAGNKVMWNANDNIRIYTQENLDGNIFNSDATAATATAKFTTTEQFTASANGYLAIYPENTGLVLNTQTWTYERVATKATYADGVWSIPVSMNTDFYEKTLPATSYPEENNFMVAFSQNNQLSFKAATALLKFTYTGSKGWPTIFFTGEVRVTGDAVLKFNTTDSSISYEGADGTQISLDGLVNGNVYYVPVYPGKISSITIMEQMETLLYVNKEIELKAGRIYNLDMPAGMSPWILYDVEDTPIAASKEGDYHVVKNVPANTNGYIFSKDGMQNSVVGAGSATTAFAQWDFTGNEPFYLTEGQNFDIYLTDDASLYFIAPAGTPIENIPAIPYTEKYALYDYQADATVKLLDMGDFYVAKNMPSSQNYVIIDQEFNMYGIAADWAEPGTWYELGGVADMATYKPFMLESDASMPCTLYLSADGKWMGYEKPYYPALPALPEPSPYYLYNKDTETLTPMIIKDGYHFAKKVDNSDAGYVVVTEDMSSVRLGFTAESAEPGVWHKSGAFDGKTYKTLPIASSQVNPASVYLSADAGWLCVTYPGYELPAVPTQSAWCLRGDHNNWGNGGVPTTPMYDMGDYSVAYGVQLTANQTFKFEHDGTWVGGNGTLTVGEWNHIGGSNIQISETGIYDVYCMKSDAGYLLMKTGSYNEIPSYIFPVKANCLYLKPTGWWLNDNAWFAAYFCNGTKEAIWVKANPAGFGGYYEIELPGTTAEYKNVIFCRMNSSKNELGWGSKWNQTGDLTWSAENNAVEIANDAIVGDWYKITEY